MPISRFPSGPRSNTLTAAEGSATENLGSTAAIMTRIVTVKPAAIVIAEPGAPANIASALG